MGILAGLNFKTKDEGFKPEVLGDMMEKAYLSMRREPTDKAKVSFAPSGLGYQGSCPRYWYYAFQGGIMREEEATAIAVANMEYGSEAGRRIQKLLDTAGILKDAEMKIINADPPIFGYGDAIIDWFGTDVMVEIKTTRQEAFVKRSLEMKAPGYQLVQLLIYMKITGIPRGLFIVENKNTGEMLFIPVSWTEENRALIEEVWAWMKTVYENKELPKRPFTKGSATCKGCAFYTHCWSDEIGDVDILPLEIPK